MVSKRWYAVRGCALAAALCVALGGCVTASPEESERASSTPPTAAPSPTPAALPNCDTVSEIVRDYFHSYELDPDSDEYTSSKRESRWCNFRGEFRLPGKPVTKVLVDMDRVVKLRLSADTLTDEATGIAKERLDTGCDEGSFKPLDGDYDFAAWCSALNPISLIVVTALVKGNLAVTVAILAKQAGSSAVGKAKARGVDAAFELMRIATEGG
ncbi:MAG: hypothetical protein ACRDTU_20370 [Micromonosporaceae bacterium]